MRLQPFPWAQSGTWLNLKKIHQTHSRNYPVRCEQSTVKANIGLCMIVRNEAAVLERCLNSLRQHISSWTIVDTGSEDNTPDIASRSLEGIPGAVHHRHWVDFGHNRSEALALNRSQCDYHLVVDADDRLEFPANFSWPVLDLDAYYLGIQDGDVHYRRLQLMATRLPWRYVGVLHEYPDCDQDYSQGVLESPTYRRHGSQGARSRDPKAYHNDAKVLAEALSKEPENTRYAFYLAQSLRDAGLIQDAAAAYERRGEMEGWIEERYCAWLQRGRLLEKTGGSPAEIRSAWLNAYQLVPLRAEALVELARYHREGNEWLLAYLFAGQAVPLTVPSDGLFVEPEAYTWKSRDERAIAAYYTDRFLEALELTRALLADSATPLSQRSRLEANVRFCLLELAKIHN